jgi:hypothetical protein
VRRRSAPRLAIAALLFAAGVAAYLSASEAPLRVHLVFVPGQAFFLFLVSYVAWGLNASARKRLLLLLLVVAAMAPLGAYASSLVIRKIEFHPIYILVELLGLTVEGALFLGVTWATDWALSAARRRLT